MMTGVSLLATSLLGGCGGEADTSADATSETGAEQETAEVTSDTASTSEVVSLRVWTEESTFELTQKIIDSFVEEYKGQATFEITMEANADSDTRNNALGDVHNAGDVFIFPDDQLNSFIAAGALDPVTNAEVATRNNEGSVSAATYNSTLYAYPLTADNGYFLYYDSNYFSEDDVKSLDSIVQICADNGKQFAMELTSGWYLYSFFGNTGLSVGLNEDGITNYCDWNSTEADITGAEITQAILNYTTNPGFINSADSDTLLLAQEGSVIAFVSGTWNATAVKEMWGDDYGACKLPTYTVDGKEVQMASFTGYKMVGVNYYSENKEWAHKLADWITNEENQLLRFTELNVGPANIVAASSEEVGKVAAITAVIDQSQYGTLQRVGNSYWDPCTEYGTILAAGNPDGKPIQDMVDTLASGIAQ